MTKRRLALGVLCVVATLPLVTMTTAAAEPDGRQIAGAITPAGAVGVTATQPAWETDENTSAVVAGADRAPRPLPPQTRALLPYCTPEDGPDCADIACPDGGTPYVLQQVANGTNLVRAGLECIQPEEQVITEAQIRAEAQRFFGEAVPVANEAVVQPAGQTLVNLPTIFAATGATEPFSRDFVAFGVLPIRLDIHPVEWTWRFGGTAVTSSTPGRAYDGTDPADPPGRYVTHTFRSTGSHAVTVTTTWTATYTVAGLGTQPVPGSVTPTSPAVDLQVRQALSEINR